MPDVGNFGTLISMCVLGVTWMIVNPLKQSIATLIKSMDKLTETIEVTRKEVNELRERMASVEAAAKSAHKRLDDFKQQLHGGE